ncbi:MAG: hypothetical protein ABIF71_05230 [Planctomycetota bacterium]
MSASVTITPVTHRGRRGMAIANDLVEVVVLNGGGHIAAIMDRASGVNPLWSPGWPSLELEAYRPVVHEAAYGGPVAGRLLASIMGHNICLDYFGDPSPADLAAGLSTHGEAPVAAWGIEGAGDRLVCTVDLPQSNLAFRREIALAPGSRVVRFASTLTNRNDRPHAFGWCEHVTLGVPFLAGGATVCDMPATWGRTFALAFGDHLRMRPETEFTWPHIPAQRGGTLDARPAPAEARSGDFSTQLMDPARAQAWFTAWRPAGGILMGYVWQRSDFPWIGNWEENRARTTAPWQGREYCRGMEFSTSPFPAGRDAAVTMAALHGAPTFRTLPPRGAITVRFAAFIRSGVAAHPGTTDVVDTGRVVTVRSGGSVLEIA